MTGTSLAVSLKSNVNKKARKIQELKQSEDNQHELVNMKFKFKFVYKRQMLYVSSLY